MRAIRVFPHEMCFVARQPAMLLFCNYMGNGSVKYNLFSGMW
jgi:hypothetical protein